MAEELLVIGVSGVTCGGKTTVATELNKILPRCKLISQDDYFLEVDDPRHTWITELNHINYDILSSLDMEKMHHDIQEFINDKKLIDCNQIIHKTFQNDHVKIKTVVLEVLKKHANLQVLIIEGFTVFNFKPLRALFHLKYFFILSKEECFKRRILRTYEPADCPGYFDLCVWPEHLKHLEEVKKELKNVKYFDEHTHCPLEEILIDIVNIIN